MDNDEFEVLTEASLAKLPDLNHQLSHIIRLFGESGRRDGLYLFKATLDRQWSVTELNDFAREIVINDAGCTVEEAIIAYVDEFVWGYLSEKKRNALNG